MMKRSITPYPYPLPVAVVDYGVGNLHSVVKSFEYVGAKVHLADHPDAIGDAAALVFPGQGALTQCMYRLVATGLDSAVRSWIQADRPFFGICLGLQVLFEHSEEGNTPGLGIFKGQVVRFRLDPPNKVPHMGWNTVRFLGRPSSMTEGLDRANDQFYFVHSYHVKPESTQNIWCETVYGDRFISGICRGNCFGTQFHPEKSQKKGLQLYRNFLQWAHTGGKRRSKNKGPLFITLLKNEQQP